MSCDISSTTSLSSGNAGDDGISILVNGLDFIVDALEKLVIIASDNATNSKRLIKYALLHLSSGIELVLKWHLFQVHWTYIFEDMNKASIKKLNSGDFISVSFNTAVERLGTMCDTTFSKSTIEEFRKLRVSRNQAEHFYPKGELPATEASVRRCVPHITNFLSSNSASLSTTSYEVFDLLTSVSALMVQINEDFDVRLKYAKFLAKKYAESGYTVTECPLCREQSLLVDGGSKCLLCRYIASGEEAAIEYTETVLGIVEVWEYPVIHECPECFLNSLVINIESEHVICFSCGLTEPLPSIQFCSECGKPYKGVQVRGISLCAPCIENKLLTE